VTKTNVLIEKGQRIEVLWLGQDDSHDCGAADE
jgi:hypothetical protein